MSRTQEKSMEARFAWATPALALLSGLCWLGVDAQSVDAAGYKTTNFVVSAPTPQLAKEIGDTAEMWRKKLSSEWLGKEMPAWGKPCPIHAKVAPNLGAGGATSFVFDRGEVFNWNMNIQGSRERILDSVLPHEVTHTIFASYFRQPLPRWADEGACTTVEHRSEIQKQEKMLIDFLKTGRGIPFDRLFAMKEYPQDVMPLYAQGHSLASWLIESRGKKAFLEFLSDGMNDENWPRAVHEHYGFDSLLAMQSTWNDWVRQGRPQLTPATSPIGTLVAQAGGSRAGTNPAIVRNQSPDDITPIGVRPPESAATTAPVQLASASGSVYASMIEKTQRDQKQNSTRTADSSVAPGSSVYASPRTRGAWR
ncbi:MAG: hypothetical protein WD468_10185 [Pirellulales bacterium]